MHFYRICLVILHIGSALCYLPHLMSHMKYIPYDFISLRTRCAYVIYWIGYSLLILGVLIWCLIVVRRKQTKWEVLQVSAYLLIAKLFYTLFDVIVRVLLRYSRIVIMFDIIHIMLLIPAIVFTFLLVHHVRKVKSENHVSQTSNKLEQEGLHSDELL